MGLPNNASRIVDAIANLESSSTDYDSDSNGKAKRKAARTLIRRSFSFAITAVNANGNNAIASNAAPSVRMMTAGRVLGAYLVPQGTATAAGADNAVFAVHKLDGTGNAGTSVASITTNTVANGGSGNLAKAATVTLTVTDIANARFSRGALLAPNVSQNGNGVSTPAGTLQVDVELEGSADDYDV